MFSKGYSGPTHFIDEGYPGIVIPSGLYIHRCGLTLFKCVSSKRTNTNVYFSAPVRQRLHRKYESRFLITRSMFKPSGKVNMARIIYLSYRLDEEA